MTNFFNNTVLFCAIVAVSVALKLLINWLLGKIPDEPDEPLRTSGRILRSRIPTFILFLLLGCPLILGLNAAWVKIDSFSWLGIFLAVFIGYVFLINLPSLVSDHSVIWNQNYLEGPSSKFPFSTNLGFGRTRFRWDEITTFGADAKTLPFATNKYGSRLYWSWGHKSFWDFEKAITHYRPELSVPNRKDYLKI